MQSVATKYTKRSFSAAIAYTLARVSAHIRPYGTRTRKIDRRRQYRCALLCVLIRILDRDSTLCAHVIRYTEYPKENIELKDGCRYSIQHIVPAKKKKQFLWYIIFNIFIKRQTTQLFNNKQPEKLHRHRRVSKSLLVNYLRAIFVVDWHFLFFFFQIFFSVCVRRERKRSVFISHFAAKQKQTEEKRIWTKSSVRVVKRKKKTISCTIFIGRWENSSCRCEHKIEIWCNISRTVSIWVVNDQVFLNLSNDLQFENGKRICVPKKEKKVQNSIRVVSDWERRRKWIFT